MKRFLIILLALVLLAAGSLRVYQEISPAMRKDPITSGETFFKLMSDGMIYDAYRSTTASLQRLNYEAFERAALRHKLNEIREIRWTRTALGETEANLTGDFHGADGETRPLSLRLVREAGQWKVVSVVSSETGSIFVDSTEGAITETPQDTESPKPAQRVTTKELPAIEELEDLARDTLLKFNEAVQIEYFAPFYQQISSAWQQQTTPAALLSAFQVFIDNRISFPGIARMKPQFNIPPAINSDGILMLDGTFPNSPYRILFELKYVYEEGKWRAFGINLNLIAATTPEPDPAETNDNTTPSEEPQPETSTPEPPAPLEALQQPGPAPEKALPEVEPQPTPTVTTPTVTTPTVTIPAFRESALPDEVAN